MSLVFLVMLTFTWRGCLGAKGSHMGRVPCIRLSKWQPLSPSKSCTFEVVSAPEEVDSQCLFTDQDNNRTTSKPRGRCNSSSATARNHVGAG